MAQQVDHLHRPGDRLGQEAAGDPGAEDAEVRPFGNEAVNRVVERDLAFLDQHHEGDRGDRLGHRIDAEDGVGLAGQAPGQVALAADELVHDLAVTGDEDLGAGHAAGLQVLFADEAVELGEAVGAEAKGAGIGHVGSWSLTGKQPPTDLNRPGAPSPDSRAASE